MDAASYFNEAAATWDDEPRRIALIKAVGEAILRQAHPSKDMDVLDYGCGTGLLGLFLLPHVASVTGADSSTGMLDVLRKKIEQGEIAGMKPIQLDLERDPTPADRYHLIVTSMVLHHTADTQKVLVAFHEMLYPKGLLCIADLDTEPGLFHAPEVAASVHHHGFDRSALEQRLEEVGFIDISNATAATVSKPVADGQLREFPVFLIVGRRV